MTYKKATAERVAFDNSDVITTSNCDNAINRVEDLNNGNYDGYCQWTTMAAVGLSENA